MADLNYGKFVLSTYCKLLIFLVLCAGAYIGFGFAAAPIDKLGPPVAAILLTVLFLNVGEGGKRSFLSKGYMVDNIVPGVFWGLAVVLVTAVIYLILGEYIIGSIHPSFDLTDGFLWALSTGFFAGTVIFGYFFHIICKDFGAVPAVIISVIVYLLAEMFLFGNISGAAVISDISSGKLSAVLGIQMINTVLMGVFASLLILDRGDMRSALMFLFAQKLSEVVLCGRADIAPVLTGNEDFGISASIIFTIVLVAALIIQITSLTKRD